MDGQVGRDIILLIAELDIWGLRFYSVVSKVAHLTINITYFWAQSYKYNQSYNPKNSTCEPNFAPT